MDGIRLPFASARMGRGAANQNEWTMSDYSAPLATGRSDRAMAATMYSDRATGAAAPLTNAGAIMSGGAVGRIYGAEGQVRSAAPQPRNEWAV